MRPGDRLRKNLQASIDAKRQLLAGVRQVALFSEAADAVVDVYRQDGRIYVAGNGGAAADAQHLAAEFVSRLARERAPLPAEALTVDSSILTAIANDYGFEKVFALQIAAKATRGDMFLGITTSGKSPDILRTLEQCRAISVPTIVSCDRDGRAAKTLADHCIIALGLATSSIQELYSVLAHIFCEYVGVAIFGE